MLLVKSLLVKVERQSAALAPMVRRSFEQGWALLERTERVDAAAVRDAVDYPTTGAWLAEVLAAPEGPAFDWHLAHLGGVAAAAAVRAGCGVGGSGTLTVPSGVLALPGLGVLRCPSGSASLDGDAGRLRITDGAGDNSVVLSCPEAGEGVGSPGLIGAGMGWSGLRMLPGSSVALDDLDPYRVPPRGIGPSGLSAAEHPHSARELWAERWREANELLSATDAGRAAEIRTVLQAVVPLAAPRQLNGAPVSATLRSAPGAVLIQLPADARELTESLVHETHHTKLAALDELMPLCRPGEGALHRVGWRPDPRPVPAVLQGAYAHLALTDFSWRALNRPDGPVVWRRWAAEQFETYRNQVGEALLILRESDELTNVGREFVRQMSRHHADLGMAARSLA
jgi:HEXXH motif-containing protein